MTQEEKAKCYDEALEIAKKNYVTVQDLCEDSQMGVECFKNTLESIFPELKENDDERIRKAILVGLIDCRDAPDLGWSNFGGIEIDDCIAWLEKQCEKDKLIRELGEYKVKYIQETLGKVLTMNNKDDERVRKTTIAFLKDFADKGYENAVECIDWLEKQGKSALEAIQEEKVDNANKIEPKDYSCIDPYFGKPIDKVEPKFKVGDWITNGDYTWKVISVDYLDYTLQNQWGECVEDTVDYVNKTFRLFQKIE